MTSALGPNRRFAILEEGTGPAITIEVHPDDLPNGHVVFTEKSSATVRRRLAAEPGENLTLTKISSDKLNADPISLTFTHGTSGNWHAQQDGRLNAVADSNYDDEETELQLSVWAGSLSFKGVAELPATIQDLISLCVMGSKTELGVTEGHSASSEVRLKTDPGDGATATAAIMHTGGSQVTIQPSLLTFTGGTSGTWGTNQRVTITPSADADPLRSTATITHEVSGYFALTKRPRVLLVINEPIQGGIADGLEVLQTEYLVNDTSTDQIWVRLKADPGDGDSVTVSPSVHTFNYPDSIVYRATSATFNPTSLTFTVGTRGTWNIYQAMTVSRASATNATLKGSMQLSMKTSDGRWSKSPCLQLVE
ncbi:MAG: hypothetical protein F4066_00735 [Chloroflexi bacterium]|nr:hypothetical protein [Chloroflexota bacterium]MYB22546.1 hypothetical protein [Chloroflexota bacterium]MYG29731.1 hypothetical protein [Holophagales bacterium]MYI03375.1 hypothetical protein [Chloroflexota bacterium]